MSGRNYTESFRKKAVSELEQHGVTEGSRRAGIDRKTAARWLDEAGLSRDEVSQQVAERNARHAAAARARQARLVAEAREAAVARTAKIVTAATIRELELLAAGGFTRGDPRDVTLSRKSAVHDLELLEGRATSRSDSTSNELAAFAQGVKAAFESVRETIAAEAGERVAELVEIQFSQALREEHDRAAAAALALEAGEVEDGDFEEVDDDTEETV